MVRGSGNVVTEEREVGSFRRVAFSCSGALTLAQGDPKPVVVEAEDNLMEHIITEVKGETLEIKVRPHVGIFRPTRPMRFQVSTPEIEGVSVSGSGSAEAKELHSKRMDLRVSGSGAVRVGLLDARDVDAGISGSGDVEVAGMSERQKVTISGSGNYHAARLASRDVEIRVSGSGNAELHASESLSARISGSGSVQFSGEPRIDVKRSGSGNIYTVEPA